MLHTYKSKSILYLIGYGNSDFSVSTRLLSSDNSHPLANSHTTGWQYMLPSDQGAVRHPHSYYYPCEPPPNKIILPQQPQSSLSTYINPLPPNPLPPFEHLHTPPGSYSRLSHSPSISPAPSSITDATNIPLHHTSSSSSIPFASTGGTDQQSEDEDEDSDSHSNNEKDTEPKKPKRTRTAYNSYQIDELELMFDRTHYPDVFNREDLSKKLGIKEDRIQVSIKFTDQHLYNSLFVSYFTPFLYYSIIVLSTFRFGFRTDEHVFVNKKELEVLVFVADTDKNVFKRFNIKCYPCIHLPQLPTKLVHILVHIQVPILVVLTLPPTLLLILQSTLLPTQLPTKQPIHQPTLQHTLLPTKLHTLQLILLVEISNTHLLSSMESLLQTNEDHL